MLKAIIELILRIFAGNKPAPKADETPPWVSELLKVKGLHERRDYAKVKAWLASAGKHVDPLTTPWCGDGVETSMLLALPNERVPENPMASINWLPFGIELKAPALGAVMVFWRGTPSGWQGHVGYYMGEDKTHYHILGTNQKDSINVTRIAKNRLRPHGIRWPLTYPLPNMGKIVKDGSGLVVTDNEA